MFNARTLTCPIINSFILQFNLLNKCIHKFFLFHICHFIIQYIKIQKKFIQFFTRNFFPVRCPNLSINIFHRLLKLCHLIIQVIQPVLHILVFSRIMLIPSIQTIQHLYQFQFRPLYLFQLFLQLLPLSFQSRNIHLLFQFLLHKLSELIPRNHIPDKFLYFCIKHFLVQHRLVVTNLSINFFSVMASVIKCIFVFPSFLILPSLNSSTHSTTAKRTSD